MWIQLLLITFAVASIDASPNRVVCYYTNWSQYRSGKGQFMPNDVDPYMCTHVIYAFANLAGLDIRPFEWNDDSTAWSKGMYEKMMDLKGQNPNLKVSLAIGGYNAGSSGFTIIAQSQSSRSTFAQAAIKFLRSRNFDGLDMDWEYPAKRGSPPQDKQNFLLLMQELMRAFQSEATTSGKPRLLLTGAFPAGKETIDDGYEMAALANAMDFINVMTYDFHGGWEQVTGMNSPLYAHAKEMGVAAYLNLDWVARYYVTKGVPKDKIVIGMATYGRGFTLDDQNQSDVGAPAAQKGNAGRYTNERGFLAYYEICEMIQSGARVVDVPSQRNRYLVQGRQWVGYDDIQSITEKACYTKQNGFGGIMFWALDLDDFKGTTCNQGRYPLINAAINEMNNPTVTNCARKTTNSNQNPGSNIPVATRATIRPFAFGSGATNSPYFNCANKVSDFYADPASCDHFYICANQVTYRVQCAMGLKYNIAAKYCDWTYNVNCQGRVSNPNTGFIPNNNNNNNNNNSPINGNQPTPAPTQAPRPTTAVPAHTYKVPLSSNPCSGQQGGFQRNPTDCNKFYQCQNGVALDGQCPSRLVFNPSTSACDFATNVPGCP